MDRVLGRTSAALESCSWPAGRSASCMSEEGTGSGTDRRIEIDRNHVCKMSIWSVIAGRRPKSCQHLSGLSSDIGLREFDKASGSRSDLGDTACMYVRLAHLEDPRYVPLDGQSPTPLYQEAGLMSNGDMMRSMFLYMAITFDGFVAGPKNDLDWFTPPVNDEEPKRDIVEIVESADTWIMGYPTVGLVAYWKNAQKNQKTPEWEMAIARAVNKLHPIVISNKEERVEPGMELLVAKE